jgi:hypothetical protein
MPSSASAMSLGAAAEGAQPEPAAVLKQPIVGAEAEESLEEEAEEAEKAQVEAVSAVQSSNTCQETQPQAATPVHPLTLDF